MDFEEKRKKIVDKKRREYIKRQFLLLNEKGIVPVLCTIFMIIPFTIAAYTSYKRDTNEIAYILAIMSLFTSVSFEIYEWYYLIFSKNISNKVLTFPCIIDFILLLIFSIIYSLKDFTINNKSTNIICCITLLVYIISVMARGIKEYKLNQQ